MQVTTGSASYEILCQQSLNFSVIEPELWFVVNASQTELQTFK